MKKLLFLFSLVACTLFVSAQTDTTQVQITEAERIIDKYGEKIINGFNNLVETVTPYAEEGFNMVIKLQIAKGIGHLLPLVFAIIFWILFHVEYKKLIKNGHYPFTREENMTATLLFNLGLSLILTFISIITTYDGIMYLIAPEWFALKEIIDLF